jgi:hypothetical protein
MRDLAHAADAAFKAYTEALRTEALAQVDVNHDAAKRAKHTAEGVDWARQELARIYRKLRENA